MKWYLPTIVQTILLPIIAATATDSQDSTSTVTSLDQVCRATANSPDSIVLNCSHIILRDLEFPESTQSSIQTTVLDLSYSDLDRLPVFVKPETFPNIQHLNLSHNVVTGSLDLKLFTELITVDLTFNNLHNMDGFICPPKLDVLSLTNNRVSVINLSMECQELRELYLQNNAIFGIDNHAIAKVNTAFHLQVLNISGNKLSQVKGDYFAPFVNLQKLYLSDNGMLDIADKTFTKLNYLETLHLSNNKLKALPSTLFSNNEHLKYLDISGNRLQTLPTNLPMLDWLDVSFNRISLIKEEYSSILYPVRVFLIGGNPLECSCEMMWLKELFNVRKYLMKYLKTIDSSRFIPICDKPEPLKGKKWDNLEDNVFECSRLVDQDLKLTNEKLASVLNEDLLKTVNITEDSLTVKWNIISTVHIDSIELIYYPFGKKKENLKSIKLSSRTTSYSINSLQANTPYVVCLNYRVGKELSDCIEVITMEQPASGVMFILLNILDILKKRLDLIAITTGILSLVYLFHIFLSSE